MKKKNLSKILYSSCNMCLIVLSIFSLTYSTTSLALIRNGAKNIFNTVNKDYEACFGKKYVHEDSYLSDITCIKMEIVTDSVTKSANLKRQYMENNNTENSLTILKDSLSDIQDYNKAIAYKNSSIPLLINCNTLYSTLNYMTYGSNALLMDIINFTDNQETLSLATDKDIQQIHVMANISTDLVLNLNKEIYIYKYILFASLLMLIGTSVNIYRLKVRKKKYRRKVK